jgi:hypothetical protein
MGADRTSRAIKSKAPRPIQVVRANPECQPTRDRGTPSPRVAREAAGPAGAKVATTAEAARGIAEDAGGDGVARMVVAIAKRAVARMMADTMTSSWRARTTSP